MAAAGIGITRRLSQSLFVVLLVGILYLLILCPSIIDAAPVTTSVRLILKQDHHVTSKINHRDMMKHGMMGMEKGAEEGGGVMTTSMVRRRAVELNDYPGSGANNRHTPRQQFGRCIDC